MGVNVFWATTSILHFRNLTPKNPQQCPDNRRRLVDPSLNARVDNQSTRNHICGDDDDDDEFRSAQQQTADHSDKAFCQSSTHVHIVVQKKHLASSCTLVTGQGPLLVYSRFVESLIRVREQQHIASVFYSSTSLVKAANKCRSFRFNCKLLRW
jgi:hypothetical protein